MGLFSRKKKTYVSSVVYNLAGDEFKRPNYLKTTVSNAIIGEAPSITDSIVGSYLNGPAMRFRSFLRWTDRTDYTDKIGLVTGNIKTGNAIDPVVLAGEIDAPVGSTVVLQNAEIDQADFSYWVDQYVSENFPDEVGTEYTADINEATGKILITFEDDSIVEFTPENYDNISRYLSAIYVLETDGEYSLPFVFIYKQLDGNAVLDAMFLASKVMRGFYPPIPFRLDNKFLSEDYLPEIYEASKKGYKKATTGKYDELIESMADNKDLKQIDYAYIVFGVCLNVMEQSSRKYIYKFFEEILNDYTTVGDPEYAAWQEEWNTANAWQVWKAAQADPEDPLYGTPEPEKLAYPSAPVNSIQVSTGGNKEMNFDMTISWNVMTETRGRGKLRPDAKPDTLWFEKGGTITFKEMINYDQADGGGSVLNQALNGAEIVKNTITLNWQVTSNTWRKLTIVGMVHKNMIYRGKAVEIDAWEALDDAEESGFIIPLHDGVFRAMGMKDGTQMTTACAYMMFNCYKVVKQKWYQTTLFKIIIVIIIIIIAYFTGYVSAEGVGLLGTNAAVGAAIVGAGAAIAVQVIVGAIVNYIAAMIVAKLITMAATELFGEKWGAIIGIIASFFVIGVGSGMQAGQSMGAAFGNLMSAQNIMGLTMAVGDSYAAYMRASAMDNVLEQQKVLETYKVESKKIKEAWETLGFDNGIIDPSLVTEAFGFVLEPPDSFLERTLMTGSDVADMSMGMLTNYARITLNTDLPTQL